MSVDETVEWLPESMMPVPQLDELNTWVMEGQVSLLRSVTIVVLLEFARHYIGIKTTTIINPAATTVALWPLCRSTTVSQHPQLRSTVFY